MAPHSSTLAWRIPWTEEPGRLQFMGSWRVGHDWETSLSLFTFMHWRRKWQPTPVFLPGESQGWWAWWAAISGVAQSRTQLKQLSSSSRYIYMKEIYYLPWCLRKRLRQINSRQNILNVVSCSQHLVIPYVFTVSPPLGSLWVLSLLPCLFPYTWPTSTLIVTKR